MSNLPPPRYTLLETVRVCFAVMMRLFEEVRALSRLPGPQGEQGPPGQDGFGVKDLTIEYDGERGFAFKFARGELKKEFKFQIPFVLDKGVWRDGSFVKGDGVTYGGSFFIAQCDTSGRPEVSKDWRLAIKRGRDGKDGQKGDQGRPGLEGRAGRDLTQITQDGHKF